MSIINEKETVTLFLETYLNMKNEIKTLNEQVKEKTIVKYYLHPIYGYVILFALLTYLTVYTF